MAFITVAGPSTNPNEELAAAENVAKIQDAIAKANAEYLKIRHWAKWRFNSVQESG
jgi:hypothetical protein